MVTITLPVWFVWLLAALFTTFLIGQLLEIVALVMRWRLNRLKRKLGID